MADSDSAAQPATGEGQQAAKDADAQAPVVEEPAEESEEQGIEPETKFQA